MILSLPVLSPCPEPQHSDGPATVRHVGKSADICEADLIYPSLSCCVFTSLRIDVASCHVGFLHLVAIQLSTESAERVSATAAQAQVGWVHHSLVCAAIRLDKKNYEITQTM